jgi:hypothetical protein
VNGEERTDGPSHVYKNFRWVLSPGDGDGGLTLGEIKIFSNSNSNNKSD